ncbi:APC family permease [Lactobacillus taiwanensis]|uniref:APC family permease n=1 Tax=Lactobacillus taiwanensis TaxID=508451 RepID=UPI00129D6088|nr:amino acid permease [Lactobacillus taiwanensis]MRM98960.1 amino acid permease [Lactobacillus taiwanensis]
MKLNPFRKESLKRYLGTDKHFAKTLGAFDLLTIGIGAVIGTGIFILPGTVAAKEAGPGVTLSFLIAALVCTLASMCYAELSSSIPVAGSAYSYGNILYGEVIGWILGWALILEYMLSVAAVSAGWASYFNYLLHSFRLHIPHHLEGPFDPLNGTYLNLWAVVSVLLIGILLSRGMKASMKFNNAAVLIKIAIIFIFIGVGLFFIKPKNYQPFTPYGTTGVLRGATTVFFAFLGFDVVSSSAAEVKNPKKNMPIGIIGTLIVAALLYMGVSAVLTGMVNYKQLDVANPVAYALKLVNQGWVADLLSIGAIVGMSTMMLTMIYSSSRLIYSIGRDGLLPSFLGKIDKHGLPENSLWIVTIVIALMGGLFSMEELTSLVSIGTLLAFTFVSFGVILLRRRKDIPEGDFKVPFYPVIPILSGLACIGMMCFLSVKTYIFASIWFLFGLFIYCIYGYKHSKINKRND